MTESNRREFLKASGAAALAMGGIGGATAAEIGRARANRAVMRAGSLTANEALAEVAPPPWQEALRRRIAAMRDGDWKVAPPLYGTSLQWATIAVECRRLLPYDRHGILLSAIGCVNDKELAGMAPGLVTLQCFDADERSGFLTFAVRRAVPWGHIEVAVPGRDPIRKPFLYMGKPLYQPFDFDLIR